MNMNKAFLKDALGWGCILWLIGYILGIVLFFIASQDVIGWIILPIGTIITLWVLFKRVSGESIQYYLLLAIVWTLIAVILDYLLLVRVFKPEDGYYKLDVYLYYALAFTLPLAVGWRKVMLQK